MKKLLMFMIAGTMVFGACKKDDPDPTPTADTTKPTITVTSPTDGHSVKQGDMLLIEGKANDNSSLKSFSVKTAVSGIVLKDSVTTISGKEHVFSQSINTAIMPPGSYVLTFTSTDAANNVSAEVVVNVTVTAGAASDTEKPKVNSMVVKLPSGDKTVDSGFDNQLDMDISDNTQIESISIELYDLDNSKTVHTLNVPKADITDPKSFKKIVKFKFSGSFGLNTGAEFRVTVMDAAGNKGEFKRSIIISQ